MFPFTTAAPGKTGAGSGAGSANAAFERAPALKEAVERIIGKIVKHLQTMAGSVTTIEGTLAGVTMEQAGDVLTSYGETAAAIIEMPDLRLPMFVSLDPTLVHAIVELLCGGNGREAPPATPRPITAIDQQFSQILFTLAAGAIQAEWVEFGFREARAAKIEGTIPPDLLGQRNQPVAVVQMTIGAFGVHGALRLVLPPAALDRFVVGTVEDGATATAEDPAWSGMLHKEIGQTKVMLEAYLDAKGFTLATLANLEVGQILELPAESRDHVSLIADGRILYRGELGQADDLYSLRIDEIVLQHTKATAVEPRVRRSPLFELSKG